jgi:hypothetical protein
MLYDALSTVLCSNILLIALCLVEFIYITRYRMLCFALLCYAMLCYRNSPVNNSGLGKCIGVHSPSVATQRRITSTRIIPSFTETTASARMQ